MLLVAVLVVARPRACRRRADPAHVDDDRFSIAAGTFHLGALGRIRTDDSALKRRG